MTKFRNPGLLLFVFALMLLAACGNKDAASHEAVSAEHGTEHGEAHGEGHGSDHESESQANPYQASFRLDGAAEGKTAIAIQISGEDGVPVEAFDISHEKLLHLIIVDHDLSYFSHIHPEYRQNGEFTVEEAFPHGGEFILYADFVPAGGANVTLSERVTVEGDAPPHAQIKADRQLTREVEGKEIELAINGGEAGRESTLTYTIRDAATKEGIDDLEPYLGAVGHVVILSEDAEEYLHVHPLDESASGPEAKFATTFPHSGIYRIWAQFRHDGEVFTVPFTVDIP